MIDHSKCPTYNSSLKKYFQNLQHYTVSHEPFKYEKSKKILLLNPLHKKDKNWGMETGNEEFQRRNCRVKNCYITSKRQLLGFSNKLSINFFLKKQYNEILTFFFHHRLFKY